MHRVFFSFFLALAAFLASPLQAEQSLAPRERSSFNSSWLFQKNDPAGTDDQLDYHKTPAVKYAVIASSTNSLNEEQRKLGISVSTTQPGFNDSAWRKLDLPHDWAVEGPFDIQLEGGTGKLPYDGVSWYRKHFTLPSSDKGKKIGIEIDGAMSYPMLWCNGHFVGGWPYGYSSFRFDLTPYLNIGGENVIAIRTQTYDKSSRWYPGAGIYRNVWLTKTSPVHVAHWGTYVTTPEINADSATVSLKTIVQNEGFAPVETTVSTAIHELGADDQPSASAIVSMPSATVKIASGSLAQCDVSCTVPNPKLWSTTTPNRYVAVTTVSVGGKVVDRYKTPFGIRDMKFTVDNGFLLNGKRVQLQGVCDHHDLGALGTAFNTRAAERQLEILKEMGVNALRTSHNMPAPELLDLCDKMGIVVMDESFDCWNIGKRGNDYNRLWNDWYEKDLRAEIQRDRNHPSVIMWSLGNEIPGQGKKESVSIVEDLVRIAHEEDPTRPSTAGGNGVSGWTPDFAKAFDILGENYEPGSYPRIHTNNPLKPIFSSESSSCVSSRGEYFFQTPEGMAVFNEILRKKADGRYASAVKKAQAAGKPTPTPPQFKPEEFKPVSENTHEGGMENFQVSSYDLYAPGWAQIPDEEFKGLDQAPYTAGEFVWTGFDYLGEPTPFNSDMTNLLNFRNDPEKQAELEKQLKELGKVKCPSRSSYFGIVDLCGFPKDRFYLYQARWRPDLPMAHILPHWNWQDRIGKVTPVHVYTSGDEAELFLNGKSLGRKKKGLNEYRLRWDDVVYQPGELKVIAYREGKEWAKDQVKTTGAATQLIMKADRPLISADGKDLSFVTVTVADKEGLLVHRSHNLIRFSISGPGEIVATDNGDATDLSVFSEHNRKAFNGLALAIVKAKPGASGPITLSAESEGLAPAKVTISGK
jgi:beta-galactosidase